MKCNKCDKENQFRLDPYDERLIALVPAADLGKQLVIWLRCMACGCEYGITIDQAIKLIEDFMVFQNGIRLFSKMLASVDK